MCELLNFATHRAQELVHTTPQVQAVMERSRITDGLVHVYAQGATTPRTATVMPTSSRRLCR